MMIEETKISVVENGTVLTDTHGTCPKCSYNFKGDDVRDYFKRMYCKHHPEMATAEIDRMAQVIAAEYGWKPDSPVYFSNIIGIEIPGQYDGVMLYQCPECETTWNRSTGKEVAIVLETKPNDEPIDGTDIETN